MSTVMSNEHFRKGNQPVMSFEKKTYTRRRRRFEIVELHRLAAHNIHLVLQYAPIMVASFFIFTSRTLLTSSTSPTIFDRNKAECGLLSKLSVLNKKQPAKLDLTHTQLQKKKNVRTSTGKVNIQFCNTTKRCGKSLWVKVRVLPVRCDDHDGH